MNITFLVGNGFDIACGIDTSYQAFYNWYLKQPSSSAAIKDLKEDIKSNWENWSDFEIGLGQYTRNFSENNIEAFFECYDDAQKNIIDFLKIQTSKINLDIISDSQIAEFKNNIINFYKNLPGTVERRILDDTVFHYYFISFNYTQILNILLNKVSNYIHQFERDKRGQVIHSQVINIHGTLTRSPLLGVSEEYQIINKELLKVPYLSQIMIKPNASKAIGEIWYDETIELIDASDIICIFGMSLGSSDSVLWERIVAHLISWSNCILIIFWYTDNPPSNISTYNNLVEKNKIKDIITKYAGLDEAGINQLKERIHVVFNTKKVLQINLSKTNVKDDKKLLKV